LRIKLVNDIDTGALEMHSRW